MRTLLVIAGIAAALAIVDRVLVWCELRGWIYYRLTPRPKHGAIGNTLLAVEELYRPSRRHVIERRQAEHVGRDADDEAGSSPPHAREATMPRDPVPVSEAFTAFVVDQLEELGAVEPRRMFGGVGLYAGDLFFGLIAHDVLYLKLDEKAHAEYEAAGMQPFRPTAGGAPMKYYSVVPSVLDHRAELARWARRALAAAARQQDAGRAPRRRAVRRRRQRRSR
jgi:DNA transformation protein